MFTYAIAIIVVLAICALMLSIGLIVRGKGIQTCGRAVEAAGREGHDIECPNCTGKAGECQREKLGGFRGGRA